MNIIKQIFASFVTNHAMIGGVLTPYFSSKKLWFNLIMITIFGSCIIAVTVLGIMAYKFAISVPVNMMEFATILGIMTGLMTAAGGFYVYGKQADTGGISQNQNPPADDSNAPKNSSGHP